MPSSSCPSAPDPGSQRPALPPAPLLAAAPLPASRSPHAVQWPPRLPPPGSGPPHGQHGGCENLQQRGWYCSLTFPFAHSPAPPNRIQSRRRRVGTGLQGFSGWGEWRPSCVPGGGRGVSLPRRPSPESGGGGRSRGGGRFRCLLRPTEWLRGWRKGPIGPLPLRPLAGLWGSVPPRPGPPTSFLGLWDLNCTLDITAQPSRRSLMSQAPIADGAGRALKGC